MPTVAELEKRIEKTDERVSVLEQNHNGLNERLIRLDAKMDGYTKDLKHVSDLTVEVRSDVKKLIQEPGNKWNTISMFVITSLIGGAIGFILSTILK